MRTRFLRRRTRRGEDITGNLVVGLKYRVYSDTPLKGTNGSTTTTTIIPSSPTSSEKPCEPVNYSSSATPDIVDSVNHHHHQARRRRSSSGEEEEVDYQRNPRPNNYSDNQLVVVGRQSPEGNDNMIVVPREQMLVGNGKPAGGDQYSADSNNNGKINVQVTVLFGTLADLKKHRSQSRFTQGGAITNGSGSLTPSEVIAATANGGGSIVTATTTAMTTTNGYADEMDGNSKIPIELSLISAEDRYQNGGGATLSNGNIVNSVGVKNNSVNLANGSTKFSGIITGDVVSDSTRSKRCCVVM